MYDSIVGQANGPTELPQAADFARFIDPAGIWDWGLRISDW